MGSAKALQIARGRAGMSDEQRSTLSVNNTLVAVATGLVCVLLGVAGCGGSSSGIPQPPSVVTHILSNPRFDGDIQLIPPTTYVVTQGMSPNVQSVLAGIDPASRTEFRAFLNFPLGGSGGVPINAFIVSAFLEVLVDNLIPSNGSIPVRVELVAFQPPTLIGTDFDRTFLPPLAQVLVSGDVTGADIGQFVPVDVTSLMIRAQQLGLVDFQVRIMDNLSPFNSTLMVIDDPITPDRAQRAPLLTVTYR